MAAGLYVHVPFCRSKCRYCAFYSVVEPERQRQWLAALEREVALRRADHGELTTLYVGGGTPSSLEDTVLRRLVAVLESGFRMAAGAERTIEANPGDVTPERARLFAALGFTRVSLGVQSFLDTELSWLGRRHDAAQAERAIELLRAASGADLSLDLVQGLPGQSLEERRWSLDRALAFDPEHLSVYELSVEPGTPLAAAGVEAIDPDLAADGLLATAERLESRGYLHYEVSSFARGASHVARHNQGYWRHAAYLGLGPAAHSFDGRQRSWNVRSLDTYCTSADPRAGQETLTDEALRWERVALGLRTSDGIDRTDVTCADDLLREQLLVAKGSRLVATQRGLLVADAMARRLLFYRGPRPAAASSLIASIRRTSSIP